MNTIKKITAIATTGLLTATMIMPAIAAGLNDLPSPFVNDGIFDANIIIGSLTNGIGLASDIAGAIDIAAAFAQKAMTTEILAVEGVEPMRLNSTTGYIGYGDSAKAQEYQADWMLNQTFDTYELTESLRFENNGGATLNNEGLLKVDFGALVYEVKSNTTLIAGQDISLFGKEYKITEIAPNSKIVFGEMTEEKGLTIGSIFSIGEKATVEIVDMDSISKEVFVNVTLTNGTVLFNDFIAHDGSKTFEDFGFSLSNLRIYQTGLINLDADWTSSLTTIEHNGNGSLISSELNDWKVKVNTDSISFSSPQYNLHTPAILLSEGEELNVLDYFKLRFEGFDNVNRTELNTYEIVDNDFTASLSYEDVNSTSHNVYLGSYDTQLFETNGLTDYLILSDSEDVYRFRVFQNDSDRFVEVFNQETTNLSEPLTTLYNLTDSNITSFTAGKGVYSLTWNENSLNTTLNSWSDSDSEYLTNLVYTRLDSENSKIEATELGGNVITVTYANNIISNEATNKYTDFGTLMSIDSEQASLNVVDERVHANIWYGRKTIDIEAKPSVITSIIPGLGIVDSEVVELTKPSILIGGGNANLLTSQISSVDTSELVNRTGSAFFELVENAFGSDETVLVIAGRDAKDTRLACQTMAGIIAGSISLDMDSNIAWLNTSVSDYTLVKVLE